MSDLIGHNGGPSVKALSDKRRRQIACALLWNDTLSASQKCIAIAIVMLPEDSEVQLGYEELSKITSIKKRDSVFDAKGHLENKKIIKTTNVPGKPNFYRIQPEAIPVFQAPNVAPYRFIDKRGTQPIPQTSMAYVPQKEDKRGTTVIPNMGTSPIPQNDTHPPKVDGSRARRESNYLTDSTNKSKNTRQPESTTGLAREGSGWQEEIPGLNGATSTIVQDLATWRSPYAPDLEDSRKVVSDMVRMYGDRAVRDGFADLKAKIADGELRVPTVKQLYGFIRSSKESGGKNTKGNWSRVLDQMDEEDR